MLQTPRQYAKENGIHPATVYRWIENENIAVVWEKIEKPWIEKGAKPKKRQGKIEENALAPVSHRE